MKIYSHIHKSLPFSLKLWGLLLIFTMGAFVYAQAQITIGGNVYGGGDMGDVSGNTQVQVLSGNIGTEDINNPGGSVFGGARVANVKGSTLVNIDGEHATDYIIINRVYGGNDISGTIGSYQAIGETEKFTALTTGSTPLLSNVGTSDGKDNVDASWNAFVHISDGGPDKRIYIGQLFGGGNGEYDYKSDNSPYKDMDAPELAKTYVDIQGGSIVYAYGGGNNATVTDQTVIHVDNPSQVVNSITQGQKELLNPARFKAMGINTGLSKPSSDAFQIGRLFGGNNLAAMNIRPTWNLRSGKVRNIYSGGNRGDMTHVEGLLLEIPAGSTIVVDDLFGGCRMADVNPLQPGTDTPADPSDIQLTEKNPDGTDKYDFAGGLSARVRISGGSVNNVYGGNDVTGHVAGGNAVDIYHSIRGNVYGGGNGSYPYTDASSFKDDDVYGDLYYGDTFDQTDPEQTEANSLKALNDFRPDAEQVMIRLKGTESEHTYIDGSVFLGGNSATIKTTKSDPIVQLKMGSYVFAHNVFLGNNGEEMITYNEQDKDKDGNDSPGEMEGVLRTMKKTDYSSINLTNDNSFTAYMDGAAMDLIPTLTFFDDYVDYSSYIGSFYCGGNVGSMTYSGKNTMVFDAPIMISSKIVGGCNNAIVPKTEFNAYYDGGIMGSESEQASYLDGSGNIKDRLVLNFNATKIEPWRWKMTTGNNPEYVLDDAGNRQIEWNTVIWDNDKHDFVQTDNTTVANDTKRRIADGNIYGGCYQSGHVNGNVVININSDIINRDEIFAQTTTGNNGNVSISGQRNSGVIFDEQSFDINIVALSAFGAGYGEKTEIWGSTTVNLNNGYVMQAYGGGHQGVVGKGEIQYTNDQAVIYELDENDNPTGYPEKEYEFDAKFSTTINLNATSAVYDEDSPALAEAEYLYGGGNEGNVCGNSYVYLGNGRIYDAFGGASNADILGHTEAYIGRNSSGQTGFPYVRDIVYGGNDFGGTISGSFEDDYDFTKRVRDYANDKTIIHGYDATAAATSTYAPEVLKAAAYVEYLQGNVDTIFGGSYGNYDYSKTDLYGTDAKMPYVKSAFVNMRPQKNTNSEVSAIFGAGTGFSRNRLGDQSQDRSYVLIDIADDIDNFRLMQVYGAGSYNGLGMKPTFAETVDANYDRDNVSAIVDLVRGKIGSAYGGSYNEGVTRRTVVNIPQGSTINVGSIFGGAYGTHPLLPCDVYESNVNWSSSYAFLVASETAPMFYGAIYGGNNSFRQTVFSHINISAPVNQSHYKYGNTTGYVYGAGEGKNTWARYTEVNLESGAIVYEAYGGGHNGAVINARTVAKYMEEVNMSNHETELTQIDIDQDNWETIWNSAWKLGGNGYDVENSTNTSLLVPAAYLVREAEMDERDNIDPGRKNRYNTNVIVKEGAVVNNYLYGGGYGQDAVVSGSTYVALLGGVVNKDIYSAGTSGPVEDLSSAGFTASANAYIEGGTVRNVYGGGWRGSVGHADYRDGDVIYNDGKTIVKEQIPDYYKNGAYTDRLGETHVVIGKKDDGSTTLTHASGLPTVRRNVYGGGEGGAVYGTAYLTINNGYIGYQYKNTGTAQSPVYEYVEELDDAAEGDNLLAKYGGNAFGGGYVANSYVDNTFVRMYGGTIRGSLFGGGEIAPVGRGTVKADATNVDWQLTNGNGDEAKIYKAGKTHIEMYNGHVMRNVFGGGRGYDNWRNEGWMDPVELVTMDRSSKGYVFGQTEVCIYGGEIGTDEGVALGDGNVFGGGDEGYVYSAYMDNGQLRIGQKGGTRYDGLYEGYYYQSNGTDYLTVNVGTTENPKIERVFTEDCKVLVEPWLQVKNSSIEYASKTYAVGDYVPTAYLNTLQAKSGDNWPAGWDNVDVGKSVTENNEIVFKERGVIIHNAVFAGGNIASGSNSMHANETTVFGNATASIHDVYNRDLITIGTGHTGGLYGDGNLTFVDGYRELNITNYGSDKFHLATELTTANYKLLPAREKAYYELKYKARVQLTDNEQTTYSAGSTLPEDEIIALFAGTDKIGTDGKPSSTYWEENGVVSTYAGRIMNTIQRADFCGVFGSRMVMKGAQDRVAETADYHNYTINRVREVSLNKIDSPAGDTDADNVLHGNYFGIYNTVNYLGSLTSDVDFHTRRTTSANTSNNSQLAEDGKTFYQWKEAHKDDRTRNNGNCHNQLALASGVYLELISEKSAGDGLNEKDWGLITGVVELDLINVQTGIGGGFVYAKNEHGVRSGTEHQNTTLTALNENAVTKWDFDYSKSDKKEWQTSGNFIHSSQTIIDDCYNEGGNLAMPAHYWFVSGQVYVYDQYISAYTGSPNAYSETVRIPITINAASNGKMTLVDVQPNLYAYYSKNNGTTINKLSGEQKLVINDVTYQLNTPISYWDWYKLPTSERNLFVEDTYITIADCKVGNTEYAAGSVLLKSEYNTLKTAVKNNTSTFLQKKEVDNVVTYATPDEDFTFDYVFRSSNNLSHENGYILTYDVTNPGVWDQWYTKVDSESREKNQTGGTGYEDGPTYHPSVSGLYGQKHYDVSNIIPKQTYIDYEGYDANGDNDYEDEGDIKGLRQLHANDIPATGQAEFVPAYLVTDEYSNDNVHYYPGAAIGESISGYTAPAYVSTATIQLSATEFIYVNELMTEAKKTEYYNRFNKTGATATELKIAEDINKLIVPAYYCSEAGDYAGSYYSTGMNYRGLEAWSSMSETDRSKFSFNYDALDLFIDPDYGGTSGKKYQYDGKPVDFDLANATEAQKQAMIYSLATPIDYTATYNGTSDETPHNGITLTNNANYSRIEYEKLPNEQRHYAAITVKAGETTYYVVKNDFIHVETPYATGTTVSYADYQKLTSDEKNNNITTLTFESSSEDRIFYYCRERYQVNEKGEGVVPTALAISGASDGGTETIEGKTWVKVGTIIGAESDNNTVGYSSLPNYQKNFTIHGVSPLETSTLYVSRNSDINDLSTEKVITVVYRYDYEESDASGLHITPVSERHVVNIHITFKSGVPIIDDISTPDIVIPGTSMVLREPDYTTGAYIVLESGWELFEEKKYAENHTNGIQYTPVTDPLYWYQDGYYLAFYTKTYLGKTYSNHVPISVANYHDLKKVMDDKKHHLYVDYDRKKLNRNSKIYINDYSEYNKDGLDLLKDFFDLSLLTSTDVTTDQTGLISSGNFTGHALLNNDVRTITIDGKETTRGVKYAKNLEFILRTNIDHVNSDGTPAAWTSIASGTGENDPCFKGTLHGDGYTISGLTGSLFGKLCGDVYNLGVTGTFTGAGIAETGGGYVESCWVLSDATTPPAQKVNAVFGNPSRGSDIQLVNSYYFIKNNALYNSTTADGITTSGGDRGYARAMSEESFYNGELAYNLNSFYLNKRYYDAKGQNTGNDYKYLDNNTLKTGYYPNPIDARYGDVGYVEERYADGDYRYADGSIPASKDKREKVITVTTNNTETEKTVWAPVWPDDYIYFGQKLTYGYDVMNPHQDLPSHYDGSTNRVYRAPAYFGDSKMSTVHFNPDAVMAATSKTDATRKAYEGMTAFDLTGKNDVTGTASDYEQGLNSKKFYGPLLDYSGITSLRTDGLTQNLLAYVNDVDTDSKTVIENYFKEPDYFMYAKQIVNETPTNYDNEYRNILPVSTEDIRNIHGHMVVKNASGNYVTTGDHFLVDYEDFNAPIEYTMGADQVMWYQRLPKVFVENAGTGWECISLPFTAKFVTTNQKGWITHFYEGSKIGHEYWLRTPDVIKTETVQSNNTETTINKLMFKSLSEASADDISAGNGANINYDNDFLWEHYYSNQDRKDKNDDDYQVYYKDPVTYNNYPFAVAANPYLIGFPGEKYYEFDMSGVFEAKNTATSAPAKIDAQTITFVSAEGISISKSDEDYNTQTGIENDTYLFKPTYQKQTGLTGLTTWLIDDTGTKFENDETKDVETVPFRAYITKRTQSGQQAHMRSSSGTKAMASTLYIGYAGDQDQLEERAAEGGLIIYGQDMNICIESHLEYETKVTVHTVAGNLLKQFTIQPGTKVQIPVNNRGVYIVNHNKVAVTK